MLQALLTVSRSIAETHHHWRQSLGRRPLSGEIARLETKLRRVEAENELLRRRILRVPARRRPYYRPWERLEILWHRARYCPASITFVHERQRSVCIGEGGFRGVSPP